VWKRRGRGARAVEAVRGASLEVAAGELVLLEGPSGAGKTTLLLIAAGLLAPDRGEATLAGEALAPLGAAGRRALRARACGFVFQRANLLDRLTVRENVLLAAGLAGLPRPLARARAEALLARLGLAAVADRLPATLSGGEEQRVAVARALVHRPAVVLADEPTGELDAASGRAVATALAELAREEHVAVLVATHDARLRPFASRRAWMADGALVPSSPSLAAGEAAAGP
jgi:putative ABC transport system ATP-binding protein